MTTTPDTGLRHALPSSATLAGDQINAGDSILVLEAMKMETNITAPQSGVIASIKVAQGARVQTGDVLVEFV